MPFKSPILPYHEVIPTDLGESEGTSIKVILTLNKRIMGEKMKVLDMILIGKLQKYLHHRFAMLIIRNTLYGLIFYLLKK